LYSATIKDGAIKQQITVKVKPLRILCGESVPTDPLAANESIFIAIFKDIILTSQQPIGRQIAIRLAIEKRRQLHLEPNLGDPHLCRRLDR
jgi:hypothetical protein